MTTPLEPQTYGPIAQFIAGREVEEALKIRVILLAVLVALGTVATIVGGIKALRALRARPGDDEEGLGEATPLTTRDGLAALGLLALAVAVRWLNLGAESISSQEVSYLYNAVPPRSPGLLTVLFDITDFNPHAPGFRWAMAWWSRVSVDLGWLRAGPAAGAALLAPALHLWLARRGLGREGQVAGLLAALSPLAVFVGRTTMPFGPLVTALALAAWAQDELLGRGGRRWTLAFALAASASVWLSYAGGTQLAVLLVAGLLRARGSPALLRRLTRGWVIAILLGLPLAWQLGSYLAIRGELALIIYSDVMSPRGAGEALRLFFCVGVERLAGGLGDPGLRAVLFVLVSGIGAAVLLRRRVAVRPVVLPLAAGFLLFATVETIGFALNRGFTYVAVRRFLLVAPFAFPLAAVGLVAVVDTLAGGGRRRQAPSWRDGAALVASLVAAIMIGVPHVPTVIRGGLRPEVREAVGAVLDRLRDGDALLFGPATFFESVFVWHASEQGVPGIRSALGPHWARLDAPRGPTHVLISRNDEFVSAPISAAPLDVRRVWVLHLLEEPLGLRELDFRNVEGYRSGLERLGFDLGWQLRLRRVEIDRWDRLPPAPPEPFAIEAGRTDYPFVRGACPDTWLPADERSLVEGTELMLPPLPGRWTLTFEGECTGACPAGLALALPPGVTATRRATGEGFSIELDAPRLPRDMAALGIRLGDPATEPWDTHRYSKQGCPAAAATYRRIDVAFAPD